MGSIVTVSGGACHNRQVLFEILVLYSEQQGCVWEVRRILLLPTLQLENGGMQNFASWPRPRPPTVQKLQAGDCKSVSFNEVSGWGESHMSPVSKLNRKSPANVL